MVQNLGYRWVPDTEKISEFEYRWVPGTEEILEVGTASYRVSRKFKNLDTAGYRVLTKFRFMLTPGRESILDEFLTTKKEYWWDFFLINFKNFWKVSWHCFYNYIFIIKAKNGFILLTRADFMVMMTKIWFKPIFKLISATNGPNEPPSGGYFKTQIRTLSY